MSCLKSEFSLKERVRRRLDSNDLLEEVYLEFFHQIWSIDQQELLGWQVKTT